MQTHRNLMRATKVSLRGDPYRELAAKSELSKEEEFNRKRLSQRHRVAPAPADIDYSHTDAA
jgi:hypothetical protein